MEISTIGLDLAKNIFSGSRYQRDRRGRHSQSAAAIAAAATW
jgi:hypothetical protein